MQFETHINPLYFNNILYAMQDGFDDPAIVHRFIDAESDLLE